MGLEGGKECAAKHSAISPSGDYLVGDFAEYVGEAEVAAGVVVGQAGVV